MEKRKRALKSGNFEFSMSTSKTLSDFAGKWVSMVDNQVVAKGTDAKVVFDKAKKKHPDKVPLIMKIPTDGVMLL